VLLYQLIAPLPLWALAAGVTGALIQLPNVRFRPVWRFALAGLAMISLIALLGELWWGVIRPAVGTEITTTISATFWLVARILAVLVGVYLLDWPQPRPARLILFLVYAVLLPELVAAVAPSVRNDFRFYGLLATIMGAASLMLLGAGFGVALPRTRQEARRLDRERKLKQQPGHPPEPQEPADPQQA
jgi:hypothetical protein